MTFTIYGKPSCGFCSKAKQFLRTRNIPFTYIDITQDAAAMKFVKEGLQAKTVPQIMLDNNGIISHVGGFTELVEYFKQKDSEEFADSLFDD